MEPKYVLVWAMNGVFSYKFKVAVFQGDYYSWVNIVHGYSIGRHPVGNFPIDNGIFKSVHNPNLALLKLVGFNL